MRRVALCLPAVLFLATTMACGGDTDEAPQPTPAPSLTPVVLTFDRPAMLSITPDTARSGDTVTGEGANFAASGQLLILAIASNIPFPLGSVMTDATGRFSARVVLPAGVPPGAYTITVRDANGKEASARVTILEPPP